ncbi:Hypothetical predicted protein [Paramuricea clavata]|uniref:Uncharacterized protein n=1 Tax=Paramuricea clavata TaxID=317549 RepID=A0A6S7KBP1_PARCT|nr:Hypothetical predicted protein [Paramuricea clavata]
MDRIDELCSMMQTVMKKLKTLDLIKDRILSVEQDVKSLKESIKFAHAELDDLKKEMKERKEAEDEKEIKIKILEILTGGFKKRKARHADARREIKIDRAHRVGRKRDDRRKPRAIVAKFSFFLTERRSAITQKIEGNTDRNLRAVSRGDRKSSTNIVSRDEKSKGG